MKNYYTIISRDEFIKLYRFGNIKLNASFILNDDKDIENKIIELFKISSFEYEEGYLILKIADDTIATNLDFLTVKTVHNLELRNVKSVYALSTQAQQFYKTKVNSKINFQICPFDNILKKVNKFKEIEDINHGIAILGKQFDFMNIEEIGKELGSDFKNDFLESDNYLSLDFKNFYLDLLSYKRENKLPNKDIAYIYDFIVIAKLQKREENFIEFHKNGNIPITKFPFYDALDVNKKETLLENIKFIQDTDDENIKKFTDNIDIHHLIAGSIFLKIKNLLLERDENTQQQILSIVDSFSGKYKDSLSMALYLIGLVFGYKNLYEDYYDFMELDIFKDSEITTIETVKQEKEINLVTLENKIKTLENEKELLNEKYESLIQQFNNIPIQDNDDLELKIKELEEQNSILKRDKEDLELQSKSSIIDILPEPMITYEKDENSHLSPITDNEIIEFSITHLLKIAKERGVKGATSKNYPKSNENKIKLYNAIINTKKIKVN